MRPAESDFSPGYQTGLLLPFGVRIFQSPWLVIRKPHPRSPARAKRRAKLGYPQHHREVPTVYRHGNNLYMHPSMFAELRAYLAAREGERTAKINAWVQDRFRANLAAMEMNLMRTGNLER